MATIFRWLYIIALSAIVLIYSFWFFSYAVLELKDYIKYKGAVLNEKYNNKNNE